MVLSLGFISLQDLGTRDRVSRSKLSSLSFKALQNDSADLLTIYFDGKSDRPLGMLNAD
jgi:hypothetical protein